MQMKITKSEAIQTSEKEFIDTINAEIDWEAIEALLLEKHNFTPQDDVDYKQGDPVVHNDHSAYKLDFQIKIALSITFGRDGDCLDITTSGDPEPVSQLDTPSDLDPDTTGTGNDQGPGKRDMSNMASNIADMISEINQGDG